MRKKIDTDEITKKKIDKEEIMKKKIDTKWIAEGHQIAIEKKEDKMDTEKGKQKCPF